MSSAHFWISHNNGFDWSIVPEPVEYLSQPQTIKIFPTSGPLRGSTNVSISGISTSSITPDSTSFCRFGELEVKAIVHSQSGEQDEDAT
jgi:hypothetical protein